MQAPMAYRCPSKGPWTVPRRYSSGGSKAWGVHRADEVALLVQHFARRAKVNHHRALLSSVMKILAGLMSRCSILCWCTMRRPAQDLVKQRADGGLAEHLVFLEIARGDDEVLQGGAFQVVHHHVDGFVLTEEVQHAHHRRVRNLRQRAAFFKKALQTQPIER